jgi:hypothetical protein
MITHFKQKSAFLFLLFVGLSLAAFPSMKFPGWDRLTKISPYIFLATSKGIPWRVKNTNGFTMTNPSRGVLHSDIEITAILKGNEVRPGTSADMKSTYWPSQGETYLIFSSYFDGHSFQAFDDYCIVPLGYHFPTNMLNGQSLDDQIRAVLQYRYNILTNEMAHAQTEKQRLEEILKK